MGERPEDRGRPVVVAVDSVAVAALVLGVVGVAASFLPVIGIVVGGLLGVLGLVAGIRGRRRGADDGDPRHQNVGLATGGIVASAIALFVVALQIVGIVTLTGLTVENFDERVDSLGNLIPGVTVSEP